MVPVHEFWHFPSLSGFFTICGILCFFQQFRNFPRFSPIGARSSRGPSSSAPQHVLPHAGGDARGPTFLIARTAAPPSQQRRLASVVRSSPQQGIHRTTPMSFPGTSPSSPGSESDSESVLASGTYTSPCGCVPPPLGPTRWHPRRRVRRRTVRVFRLVCLLLRCLRFWRGVTSMDFN